MQSNRKSNLNISHSVNPIVKYKLKCKRLFHYNYSKILELLKLKGYIFSYYHYFKVAPSNCSESDDTTIHTIYLNLWSNIIKLWYQHTIIMITINIDNKYDYYNYLQLVISKRHFHIYVAMFSTKHVLISFYFQQEVTCWIIGFTRFSLMNRGSGFMNAFMQSIL